MLKLSFNSCIGIAVSGVSATIGFTLIRQGKSSSDQIRELSLNDLPVTSRTPINLDTPVK